MRAGDMVLQSEFVAHWAKDQSIAFVGDGDAIGVCVAYLRAEGILDYGPAEITVFDFDERIVRAVTRFAEARGIEGLGAQLYNVLDPIPDCPVFDSFYSNPPWGASNGGQSVNVFVQRGMELIGNQGNGLVVVADRTPDFPWTEEVLANVQAFAAARGFYVSRMMQRLHSYHLDDNPELLSCNLILRSRPENPPRRESQAVTDPARLENFYGLGGVPTVRYVRERSPADYGKALREEYELEHFEEADRD
jgi:predicted RNA methylase